MDLPRNLEDPPDRVGGDRKQPLRSEFTHVDSTRPGGSAVADEPDGERRRRSDRRSLAANQLKVIFWLTVATTFVLFGIWDGPEKLTAGTALASVLVLAGAAASGIAVLASYVMARRAIRPMAEALATQRRFVPAASHELRTPLTLLSMSAQLLSHRHRDGRKAVVSVLDDSPGFSPDLVPHAFEPFVAGRAATDHSGLGLAIVAETTRRHHGRVPIRQNDHGAVVLHLPPAGG